MKVRNFKHKNQYVIEDGRKTHFQSYDSLICTVDEKGHVTLYPDWDYSNTTRRHLYQFLREYTAYQVQNKRDVEKLIKEGVFQLKEEGEKKQETFSEIVERVTNQLEDKDISKKVAAYIYWLKTGKEE